MRLGFSISGHRDARSAVKAAVAAEEAGYDEIWLTEDYCERGAFAVAGAISASTSKIRVGIGVVNPWTRHPALIAMEFAALDEMSGGRGILGLGASNAHWMSDQLGIPFQAPLARTLEAVQLIRELLTGEPVRFHGQFYDIDTRLSFVPVRPDPPLVLGIKGPRAIRAAGTTADRLLLSFLASPSYVRWVREQVGANVQLSAYIGVSLDSDPIVARHRIRPTVAHFLGVHGDHMITRLAGVTPQIATQLREGWLHAEPRVDLVSDDILAAVVAAGTPQDVAATLSRFATAGLDIAIIRDDPTTEPHDTLRAMAQVYAAHDLGAP